MFSATCCTRPFSSPSPSRPSRRLPCLSSPSAPLTSSPLPSFSHSRHMPALLHFRCFNRPSNSKMAHNKCIKVALPCSAAPPLPDPCHDTHAHTFMHTLSPLSGLHPCNALPISTRSPSRLGRFPSFPLLALSFLTYQ